MTNSLFWENIRKTALFHLHGAVHFWQPTRQPIVLDYWAKPHSAVRDTFTTVMAWQPDGGRSQSMAWPMAVSNAEFGKFIDLPRLTVTRLGIGHWWRRSRRSPASVWLVCHRWVLRSRGALEVPGVPLCLKSGVQRSQTGLCRDAQWLVQLSKCVLPGGGEASHRQDTGFSEYIPTGEGYCSVPQRRLRLLRPSSTSIEVTNVMLQRPLCLAQEFF